MPYFAYRSWMNTMSPPGAPVFMARNAWHLDQAAKDFPDVRFLKTKEQTR